MGGRWGVLLRVSAPNSIFKQNNESFNCSGFFFQIIFVLLLFVADKGISSVSTWGLDFIGSTTPQPSPTAVMKTLLLLTQQPTKALTTPKIAISVTIPPVACFIPILSLPSECQFCSEMEDYSTNLSFYLPNLAFCKYSMEHDCFWEIIMLLSLFVSWIFS